MGINHSNDLNVLIVIIIMDVYALDDCVFVLWEAGEIQMC